MTRRRLTRLSAFSLFLFAGACAGPAPSPKLTLAAMRFADLPGWSTDHLAEALPAFRKSCTELAGRADDAAIGPPALHLTAAAWRAACAAGNETAADDAAARAFFEDNFTPYLVGNNGVTEGLFTGYYEPLLHGARARGGPYQTPILKRPPDLVMVELARFRPAWHGERIAGRVVDGSLIPYPSRAEIERGALDTQHLEILWVDDPVAAFFLQVQGSGRIDLPDGSRVELGYDGQNGQPYVAIGRLLVARGELALDAVSLQSISAWIKAHPTEGAALMDENPSYVFFREQSGDGPLGAEGVTLTAARSLAIDRGYIPLGAPVFLDIDNSGTALQRLVIAQDTGGAISGPVRGDVFWGFGAEAEAAAGPMRARGRYYLLLPKAVPVPLLATTP